MKKTEAHLVGDILEDMMQRAGKGDDMARYRVSFLWPEVVGPGINRFTARRYVDGDVLHVYITSASLKSELSFLRAKLVARLNEAVGKEVIRDIVIH